MKPGNEPDSPDSPVYHLLLKFAILLAMLSLVALGVSAYRHPDADNEPALFSCSSLPFPP